jgi:hypothetical protein
MIEMSVAKAVAKRFQPELKSVAALTGNLERQ